MQIIKGLGGSSEALFFLLNKIRVSGTVYEQSALIINTPLRLCLIAYASVT